MTKSRLKAVAGALVLFGFVCALLWVWLGDGRWGWTMFISWVLGAIFSNADD